MCTKVTDMIRPCMSNAPSLGKVDHLIRLDRLKLIHIYDWDFVESHRWSSRFILSWYAFQLNWTFLCCSYVQAFISVSQCKRSVFKPNAFVTHTPRISKETQRTIWRLCLFCWWSVTNATFLIRIEERPDSVWLDFRAKLILIVDLSSDQHY